MAPDVSKSDRQVWQTVTARNEAGTEASSNVNGAASEVNAVITKEQFMGIFAQMALPKRRSQAQQMDNVHEQPDRLVVLPLPAPPPGLSAPSLRGKREDDMHLNGGEASSIEPLDGTYQVLLCGLPDTFLYCNVIAALLKAVGLEDGVTGIAIRSNGKVRITFPTIAMVDECIRYFNDPEWIAAGFPLSALYVQTVTRTPVFEPINAPEQEHIADNHEFSLNAPVFVPAAGPATSAINHEFSANAPEFKPATSSNHECSPRMSAKKLSANAAEYVPSSPGESTNADHLSDAVPEGFELETA